MAFSGASMRLLEAAVDFAEAAAPRSHDQPDERAWRWDGYWHALCHGSYRAVGLAPLPLDREATGRAMERCRRIRVRASQLPQMVGTSDAHIYWRRRIEGLEFELRMHERTLPP